MSWLLGVLRRFLNHRRNDRLSLFFLVLGVETMPWLLDVLRSILNHTRNHGDHLPHDSSSQRQPFSQRKLPEAGASPSPLPSSSSPRSSVISSVSEIKPPISTEPSKRSLEKPHQSSPSWNFSPTPPLPSSPLPSSCSATRTIGSISERKSPISKEPWERSLEKPSSTDTRDCVKLSTTSSLSDQKKPGSLIEPNKTSLQNSRSSITSPSPLPFSCSAVDTGVCVPSVSAENKLLVSGRKLLEKPCETSSSSISSPSPTIPSSKASVSPPPPPPAPPLKASPSSLTNKELYTPSRKASPPSSPFKLPEPEKRSPGPTKIEQRIRYEIPRHLQEMIKWDVVPPVLKIPLSPATYADFFATLLYAEDFYLEAASERPAEFEKKPRGRSLPGKKILVLCTASFFMGLLFMGEVSKTHQAIQSLDKSISSLEMELAVARANQNGGQASRGGAAMGSNNEGLQKAFLMIGINTAFSSKKRRDSVRETWMPRGPGRQSKDSRTRVPSDY